MADKTLEKVEESYEGQRITDNQDKKETAGAQQRTKARIKVAAVRVDQRVAAKVAVRQTNHNAEGPLETGLLYLKYMRGEHY